MGRLRLEGDLDEEFEALEGLRWSEADFDAFVEAMHQTPKVNPKAQAPQVPCGAGAVVASSVFSDP